MSRTRVHNFSISLDGFGTGEPQSLETPFGHAGERLHEWMFVDSTGVDGLYAQQYETGIGAEIMGANKFGPPGWHEDPEWKGWWGDNPPYHHPAFVLTHHEREPIEMEGGTTFYFRDATPAEKLKPRNSTSQLVSSLGAQACGPLRETSCLADSAASQRGDILQFDLAACLFD
jgi:dihydrofolate reductase